MPRMFDRSLRWISRASLAVGLLAVGSTAARAQYGFGYAVWNNYVSPGDGSPFSGLLCSGTTSVINYDNNPLTSNPKIQTWCPAVGPAGDDFGAQFGAYLFAPVTSLFQFYVGSDDGSALYIDGTPVLAIVGEQPFTSGTVFVPFQAGTTHSFLINYYANNFGGSAIQATVDNRLDVTPQSMWDVSGQSYATPEPASIALLATGLFGVGISVRRRSRQQRAAILP